MGNRTGAPMLTGVTDPTDMTLRAINGRPTAVPLVLIKLMHSSMVLLGLTLLVVAHMLGRQARLEPPPRLTTSRVSQNPGTARVLAVPGCGQSPLGLSPLSCRCALGCVRMPHAQAATRSPVRRIRS